MNFCSALGHCWNDCRSSGQKRSPKIQSLYEAYWMYLLVSFLYFTVLALVLTIRNFLTIKMIAGNSVYFMIFLGMWAFSFWSFISLRNSDPGMIPALSPPQDKEIEEEPNKPDLEFSESAPVRRKKKIETIKAVPPPNIPIRAKYCRQCEAFIAKHDHHCFWIGICVGERNHYHFIRFLVSQIVFIFTALVLALHAFYLKIHQFQELGNGNPAWLIAQIVVMMVLFFIGFFLIWLPIIMLVYHAYLVATNQTSYETGRPYKCEYFKNIPKDSAKFDQGVWKNCLQFLFDKTDKFVDWKVNSEKESGNCCKTLCCLCINESGDCCCD